MWEDSVELSRRFITARDQYAENGSRLQSKALEYTLEMLEKDVKKVKEAKSATEVSEEDAADSSLMETDTQVEIII